MKHTDWRRLNMKTFKAKKNKGAYKSTDHWIEAVYRNNKAVIDKELSFAGNPKKVFKQMVKENIAEGLSPTKAVSTIARSTLFTPETERLRNNMLSGLRSDKGAFRAFRELTKEKGKYAKFDPNKLHWDSTDKVYIYGGNIVISFQNSPYGVLVRRA